MSSPPILQQLRLLNRSSPDFHEQLGSVLYGQEHQQCVPNLQGDDLMWLVDYLDKAFDDLDPSGPISRKCLRELRNICGTRAILPTSYMLTSELLNIEPHPFTAGHYGDVYHGTLDDLSVCIKRVRVYAEDPQKAAKSFCQEAVMWKRLTHPNVLPLLGVTIDGFQLISNWMPGGHLLGYIKKNSEADRLGLLSDVAKGLCYLHSCNVIHGDLKGLNILVDDSDHARITDFGLATVTQNLDSIRSTQPRRGHTTRWAAPEILDEGPHSKEADVFAFAMVMIEVFTAAVPFSDRSDAQVICAIMQRRRPPRPTHPTFTENLWILMQRCWDHDPRLRPEVSEALRALVTPEDLAWKRLISHTLTTREHISSITKIFSDSNQAEMNESLIWDDAQNLTDVIDEIVGERPVAAGGFTDIWMGKRNGRKVVLKSYRCYRSFDVAQIAARFCNEVRVCNLLQHGDVDAVPFMGVYSTEEHPFGLVYEFVENLDLRRYLRDQPNAGRLELIVAIAKCLRSMLGMNIVHGDLETLNILVDKGGTALIAGLGHASVLPHSAGRTAEDRNSASRYSLNSAPEIVHGSSLPTKASDMYAFGVMAWEVLTGHPPFSNMFWAEATDAMLNGARPSRPDHHRISDLIWYMIERCWRIVPSKRVSAEEVVELLEAELRRGVDSGA